MRIFSVYDQEFRRYGRVLTGYDTQSLTEILKQKTPCPEGVSYVPSERQLEQLPEKKQIQEQIYGGIPVQLGWCNGHNTKLNCLEYHRNSEINLGATDFILLLALQQDIEQGIIDTKKVQAFCCPANVLLELYATTLHYAPCEAKKGHGFRVMVALPEGTNTDKPGFTPKTEEDTWMTAQNKWLLAHEESVEAANGAHIGLKGTNIDLANYI